MTDILPKSPTAFRDLVQSARREPQRDDLLQRIQGDAGPRPTGAARRLYEARLLEFTRIPAVNREFGWDLAVSHEEAWSALVDLRSTAFAKWLRVFSAHDDAKLAAAAAKYLAWMAFDSDLPGLMASIDKGPWPLRRAIADGARLAAMDRYASKKFRARVFEALSPLSCGEIPIPATRAVDEAMYDIVEALPAIDRSTGYRLLTSARALRPGNPAIRQIVLRLYSDRDDSPPPSRDGVDPELLWPVYESLRKRSPKLPKGDTPDRDFPYEQTMGCILQLAAYRDPLGTARECNTVLADKRIKKGSPRRSEATAALKRCRGIPGPSEMLQEFYRQPKKFGRRATEVIRAYELYDHFLSDGLPLYFGNLGEHWHSAHAGLHAVGADSAASILQSGAAIVEKFGPMKDHQSVIKTFAEVDGPALRKLEALDKKFDRESKAVLAAIERCIAQRPQDFGGRSSRSA